MSCGCENKKALSDLERVRKLAKVMARMEQCVYVIYQKKDGTYNFVREGEEVCPIEYVWYE